MLVALLDIPFFDQLARITPRRTEALVASMGRRFDGVLDLIVRRRGRFLWRFSADRDRDVGEALTRLETLRRHLDEARIAGHLCLVYDAAALDGAGLEREAERLLLRLEAGGLEAEPAPPLWRTLTVVHRSAAARVGTLVALDGEGEFVGARARAPLPPTAAADRTPEPGVLRPNVTNRVVDAAFESLEDPARRLPVMVSGPDSVGKARAVLDAAGRIMGEGLASAAVVVHTLFGRRSAIHPFLNSIREDLLAEIPGRLHPWELRVWSGRETLVRSLAAGVTGAVTAAPPDRAVCPDRLNVDFASAFRIYLLGYTRAMEARGVPALVVFEDVHTYHADALRLTVSVVRDMLRVPGFVPVLTCREGHDACGMFGTDVIAVRAPPFSLDEVRVLSRALYPGLRLPEKAARRVRAVGRGGLAGARHALRHLERGGKIVAGPEGYRWVAGIAGKPPPDAAAAAWEEIESLDLPSRELLLVCGLAGGILPASRVVDLALALDPRWSPAPSGALSGDHDRRPEGPGKEARRRAVTERLRALAEDHLVRSEQMPVFLHPRLRGRLAGTLGSWAERARRLFVEQLERAWLSGEARNLVLVYSVLAGEQSATALDVLGDLVTRKLDELNIRGCRHFLDPARKAGGVEPPESYRERRERIAAVGELRSSLLLGAWQRAEQAMDRVANLDIPEDRVGEQAERALGQARFHLAKGDAPAAAKSAKSAVILFHEARNERLERRAEAELGAALLGEGRLEEALEYFGFVFRSEAADALPRIRAATLAAVSSYLLGDITASSRLAEEGAALADRAGRREWQALLVFFRARHHFDLGRWGDASRLLEELLAFTRIYGMDRARAVVAAWMGRCLAYGGTPAHAVDVLARLEQSGEVSYFRAEALFLDGQVQAALRILEPGAAPRRRMAMDPGERVSWESGFASVEERCAVLRRDGGTLYRLSRGFRAYLTARDGRPEQAMRELHRITREERVAELDPYLPLYGYWYATTLPEEGAGTESTDHKITVLNRAMKHLQQRSSRIEKARDRYDLMTANYWNARLLEEARARRLV